MISAYKKILFASLTALVVFYIIVTGVNLLIRFTVAIKPECNPLYCQQVQSENSSCLIKTPGFSECVGVDGAFFILSTPLAYLLLGCCFIFAYFLSRRFFISRFLIFFLLIALIIIITRIVLGAIDPSVGGILVELNKSGLNHPFIQKSGETLFNLFNPKLR